ncbi:MAG: SRPBCC domain-containing protein [Planctomycetota bacterium]
MQHALLGERAGETPTRVGDIPVPAALAELYRESFGSVRLNYYRKLTAEELAEFHGTAESALYGGPMLTSVGDLPSLKALADEWIVGFEDDPEQAGFWRRSVPFLCTGNGDYISFDDSGRIIYLSHEGGSFILADDFQTFWSIWERVYFIGPEHWTLEPFCDDAGRLDPSSPAIDRFRNGFEALLTSSDSVEETPDDQLWISALPRSLTDPPDVGPALETITTRVEVAAPIEHAWEAWTDPEAIRQWYSYSKNWSCQSAHIDFREGGSSVIRIAANDGSESIDLFGKYCEIVPPSLLVFELYDEYPTSISGEVRVSFKPTSGGGTEVVEAYTTPLGPKVERERLERRALLDRFRDHLEAADNLSAQ